MMLILMKMILKLLFMSVLWFNVIDLNNTEEDRSKESIPAAWNLSRWWELLDAKRQKKELKLFLTGEKECVAVIVSTKINALVKHQLLNGEKLI